MNTMTNDMIRSVAPSVFATRPWGEVSDRYSFIPTIEVVDALRNEGFHAVKASQSRSRIAGKAEFTKHLLRFRHADHMGALSVGDEIPEIVLVNSHDRSSGFQLSAGIFRLACTNGMVVKSSDFGDVSIRHSGDVANEVVEGSLRIIEDMPAIMDGMNVMKGINLSAQEQLAYANAALQLRYPQDDIGNSSAPIEGHQLLKVRRYADNKADLWTTFNRVQENMVRGGLRGVGSTGRRMTTRKIASVNEDLRLNKSLWMLTEALAALKH